MSAIEILGDCNAISEGLLSPVRILLSDLRITEHEDAASTEPAAVSC